MNGLVGGDPHPTKNRDPSEAILEGDVHVTMDAVWAHKVGEAPGVPPVCVYLSTGELRSRGREEATVPGDLR
jgi:hypothetical protein